MYPHRFTGSGNNSGMDWEMVVLILLLAPVTCFGVNVPYSPRRSNPSKEQELIRVLNILTLLLYFN